METRPSDGYLRAFTRLGHLVLDGDLGAALVAARRMRSDFPAWAASAAHTEACLLALDGRADEAVGVLAGLVGEGRWLSRRQLADPDLASLASHPSYDALTATMRDREEQATRAARATRAAVTVARPRGPIHATVVVLHMLGVSGAETAAIWAPVVDAGIAVVTVESSLCNGDGLPCWDDTALAERDVHTGVEAARGMGAPLVLAGGSQGAGVAARLALGGTVEGLAGFLCVVGAPAAGTWRLEATVPGVLVIGGDDPLTAARQRQFQAELGANGVAVEVFEVPDLRHVYPDDWGTLAPPLVTRLVAGTIAP
jgi:predicted esterase